MDPQVDEETEMPEEDVVLAEDAVAGVLGDPGEHGCCQWMK